MCPATAEDLGGPVPMISFEPVGFGYQEIARGRRSLMRKLGVSVLWLLYIRTPKAGQPLRPLEKACSATVSQFGSRPTPGYQIASSTGVTTSLWYGAFAWRKSSSAAHRGWEKNRRFIYRKKGIIPRRCWLPSSLGMCGLKYTQTGLPSFASQILTNRNFANCQDHLQSQAIAVPGVVCDTWPGTWTAMGKQPFDTPLWSSQLLFHTIFYMCNSFPSEGAYWSIHCAQTDWMLIQQ